MVFVNINCRQCVCSALRVSLSVPFYDVHVIEVGIYYT